MAQSRGTFPLHVLFSPHFSTHFAQTSVNSRRFFSFYQANQCMARSRSLHKLYGPSKLTNSKKANTLASHILPRTTRVSTYTPCVWTNTTDKTLQTVLRTNSQLIATWFFTTVAHDGPFFQLDFSILFLPAICEEVIHTEHFGGFRQSHFGGFS